MVISTSSIVVRSWRSLKNAIKKHPYLFALGIAALGVSAFFTCGATLLPAFLAVMVEIGAVVVPTLIAAAGLVAALGIPLLISAATQNRLAGSLALACTSSLFLIFVDPALSQPPLPLTYQAVLACAPVGIVFGVLAVGGAMLGLLTWGIGKLIKIATKNWPDNGDRDLGNNAAVSPASQIRQVRHNQHNYDNVPGYHLPLPGQDDNLLRRSQRREWALSARNTGRTSSHFAYAGAAHRLSAIAEIRSHSQKPSPQALVI